MLDYRAQHSYKLWVFRNIIAKAEGAYKYKILESSLETVFKSGKREALTKFYLGSAMIVCF